MQKSLSLRWLEVFQLIAKSGSIQQVASETDLSISTVSNHLRSLETALSVDLVDHGRRPMGLTPAGEVFAVGYNGVVLRYDGEVWDTMPTGYFDPLNAIHIGPCGDIYAAGFGGHILKYGN